MSGKFVHQNRHVEVMRLGKPLAHFSLEALMQLPDAEHWKTDWDGPCPEQAAPDYMARAFADMCRRVEELEDEIAELRKR